MQKLAMQGQEIDEEQLEQMTMEQVKDQLDSYTSVAEKWANHVLTCQKAEEWADCVNDNNYKFFISHPAAASYTGLKEWDCKNVRKFFEF